MVMLFVWNCLVVVLVFVVGGVMLCVRFLCRFVVCGFDIFVLVMVLLMMLKLSVRFRVNGNVLCDVCICDFYFNGWICLYVCGE